MPRLPDVEKSLQSLREEKFTEEQLIKKISMQLLSLIRYDHQKVINLLYKYDIDEQKARLAFKLINDEDIANELACLIVQREAQKIALRKKYAQFSADDTNPL